MVLVYNTGPFCFHISCGNLLHFFMRGTPRPLAFLPSYQNSTHNEANFMPAFLAWRIGKQRIPSNLGIKDVKRALDSWDKPRKHCQVIGTGSDWVIRNLLLRWNKLKLQYRLGEERVWGGIFRKQSLGQGLELFMFGIPGVSKCLFKRRW